MSLPLLLLLLLLFLLMLLLLMLLLLLCRYFLSPIFIIFSHLSVDKLANGVQMELTGVHSFPPPSYIESDPERPEARLRVWAQSSHSGSQMFQWIKWHQSREGDEQTRSRTFSCPLLIQISGKKRWTLVQQKYYLYTKDWITIILLLAVISLMLFMSLTFLCDCVTCLSRS